MRKFLISLMSVLLMISCISISIFADEREFIPRDNIESISASAKLGEKDLNFYHEEDDDFYYLQYEDKKELFENIESLTINLLINGKEEVFEEKDFKFYSDSDGFDYLAVDYSGYKFVISENIIENPINAYAKIYDEVNASHVYEPHFYFEFRNKNELNELYDFYYLYEEENDYIFDEDTLHVEFYIGDQTKSMDDLERFVLNIDSTTKAFEGFKYVQDDRTSYFAVREVNFFPYSAYAETNRGDYEFIYNEEFSNGNREVYRIYVSPTTTVQNVIIRNFNNDEDLIISASVLEKVTLFAEDGEAFSFMGKTIKYYSEELKKEIEVTFLVKLVANDPVEIIADYYNQNYQVVLSSSGNGVDYYDVMYCNARDVNKFTIVDGETTIEIVNSGDHFATSYPYYHVEREDGIDYGYLIYPRDGKKDVAISLGPLPSKNFAYLKYSAGNGGEERMPIQFSDYEFNEDGYKEVYGAWINSTSIPEIVTAVEIVNGEQVEHKDIQVVRNYPIWGRNYDVALIGEEGNGQIIIILAESRENIYLKGEESRYEFGSSNYFSANGIEYYIFKTNNEIREDVDLYKEDTKLKMYYFSLIGLDFYGVKFEEENKVTAYVLTTTPCYDFSNSNVHYGGETRSFRYSHTQFDEMSNRFIDYYYINENLGMVDTSLIGNLSMPEQFSHLGTIKRSQLREEMLYEWMTSYYEISDFKVNQNDENSVNRIIRFVVAEKNNGNNDGNNNNSNAYIIADYYNYGNFGTQILNGELNFSQSGNNGPTKFYHVNVPGGNLVNPANVENVHFKTEEGDKTLPVQKVVLNNFGYNGALLYAAVEKDEMGIAKAYYILGYASLYEKAEMSVFGKSFALRLENHNGKMMWQIDYARLSNQDNTIVNQVIGDIKNINPTFNLYDHLTDKTPSLTVKASDFAVMNKYGIHTNSYEYYKRDNELNYSEKGLIGLDYNDCLEDYKTVSSASFMLRGKKYTFDLTKSVVNGKIITYYLNSEELNNMSINDIFNGERYLKLNYASTKGKQKEVDLYSINGSYINGKETNYFSFYYTNNGDPDYQVRFVIFESNNRNNINQEMFESSYIRPVSGIDYSLYRSERGFEDLGSITCYSWSIFVDPKVSEFVLAFENYEKQGNTIAVKDILDSGEFKHNDYYYSLFEVKNDQHTFKYNKNTYGFAFIEGIVDGVVDGKNIFREGTDQYHQVNYSYDTVKCMDYTPIASHNLNLNNAWISDLNFENNKEIFSYLNLSINDDVNNGREINNKKKLLNQELISAINNNDFSRCKEVEQELLGIVFKPGASVTRSFDLGDNDIPNILYNITYNGEKQKLNIRYDLRNNQYGGEFKFNGQNAYSEMLIKDGELYNLYVLQNRNSYSNINDSFELINYKHNNILGGIESTYNANKSTDQIVKHFNGKDYFIDRLINFNYYNLDGIEIKGNGQDNEIELLDLRITDLDSPSYYKTSWFGGSYSLMLRKIEEIKSAQTIGYVDNDGRYCFDLEYCETKADLDAYDGDNLAFTLEIKKQSYSNNSDYCLYITFKMTELNSIFFLNDYFDVENLQADTEMPTDLDFSGMSNSNATDTFARTINNYYNSGDVTIKLLSDLTLDKDVYLRHGNYKLTIDLNGHNINALGHTLEIPAYTNVSFANSNADIESKIYGNSNGVLLESYSGLEMQMDSPGKIKFVNNNGTVIKLHGERSMDSNSNLSIEGKIGIYFDLNYYDLSSQNDIRSCYQNFGNNIKASDIAVVVDAENTKNLYSGINFSLGSCELDSSNIGALIKGPVNIRTSCVTINAKSPLICLDPSKITIDNSQLIVNSGSYNSTYDYTKHYGENGFTTNGAAITVDSSEDKEDKIEIDIKVENNNKPIRAAGPVITEVKNCKNESNISIITIESYTWLYIYDGIIQSSPISSFELVTYGSNNIYENINDSKVEVVSGLYSKAISEDIICDSSTYSYPKDQSGKTYTLIVKESSYANVENEEQLKDALQNKAIDYVNVNSDINASTYERLNINAGKGGKTISLNGHTLNGYSFVVDGMLSENDWRSTIRVSNGTIVANSSSFPTLSIRKGNLQVDGAEIRNVSGVAIESEAGRVNVSNGYIWDSENQTTRLNHSKITGTKGIVINNTSVSNDNYSLVDVSGANILATAGPAIEFVKTPRNSNLYLSNYYVDGDQENECTIESKGNYPAVLVGDSLRSISINDVTVKGANAIKVDIVNGVGPNIYLNGSTVYATEDAFDLKGQIDDENYNQNLYISKAEITAGKNVVKSSYYQVTIEDGTFNKGEAFKFIDNNTSSNGRYSNRIYGGKYNANVGEREIFSDTGYTPSVNYACYAPTEDGGYYEVAVKTANGSVAVSNIAIANKRTVKIDQEALAKVAEKQENASKVTMSISESEGNGFNEELNVKESFDISVNANGKNLEALTDYQKIVISVSDITTKVETGDVDNKTIEIVPLYNNPENIIIYHNHDGEVNAMKKVEKPTQGEPDEECYYISEEDGLTYVNIITRRFSEYGFAENDTEVSTSALKEFKEMTLSYDDTYTVSSLAQKAPTTATIELDGKQVNVDIDEVSVVYRGENNFISENELPSIPGVYEVEWILDENSAYGVKSSGTDTFTLRENVNENSFAKADSYSVSTDGNVAINFCFWLTDVANQDESAKAVLSCGSNSKIIYIKDLGVLDSEGSMKKYKVTYSLNSKEMGSLVTLKLVDGEDREIVIKDSNNTVIGTEWTSSINQYLETVIESEGEYSNELLSLANAMYDFGQLAKSYFNKKAPIPTDAVEAVTIDDLRQYKAVETGSSSFRKSLLRQSSLVLETETTIKHYFKHAEGYTYNVTDANGNVVNYKGYAADGYYVIEIKDIAAKDLNKTYVVTIKNANNEVYTLKYSALSYAYDALYYNSSDSLQLLARSLYLYNREAVTYFTTTR